MKKKIMALVSVVALVVTMVLGLTACNDKTDWEYIQSRGKIVVGYTDYPPLDEKVDGKLARGFDYELAKAVGEILGLKVEFYEIPDWGNKGMDLNSKKIDCVWNGMTVSEELKKNMSVSKPYLRNRQAVVVKNSETKYTDLNSLKGAKIGAEKGSAGASFIEDNNLNENYTKADKQLDLFMNLDSSINDVVVLDSILAGYYMTLPNYQGKYKVLDGVFGDSEQFAVGFRKEDTVFTQKVNDAIQELYNNGKLMELAQKYGLATEIIWA